jgi:predicted hotdog family 3-hydroxylacyl-ACP dehydratase
MSDGELPPIRELIPHRGESILIDRVIEHDGDSTTTGVVVGSQRWLRQRDGSVASWLAIEYMAQCIAAHEGLLARAAGHSLPLGFLVGVKGLRLGVSRFDRDEELRVQTRRIRGRPGLGVLSHSCAISLDGDGPEAEPIAEGRLLIVVERTVG